MDRLLQELVWRRASQRCEYCQMPQSSDPLPFEIDHIIAESHDGKTVASNLCICCFACNRHKGPNIAGIDPKDRENRAAVPSSPSEVDAAFPVGRPGPDRTNAKRASDGPCAQDQSRLPGRIPARLDRRGRFSACLTPTVRTHRVAPARRTMRCRNALAALRDGATAA